MSAVFKREFKTFFTSPIAYFILAIIFSFAGYDFVLANVQYGMADLS